MMVLKKKPEETCYYIQFYDVPAIEVEVCATTEKEARKIGVKKWRRDPENRPKIMAIIKKSGSHG